MNPTTLPFPKSFCPYCGVTQNKNFVRHLKDHHPEEPTVQTLIKLSNKGSSRKEIQKITGSLRKLGRYRYMHKRGSESAIPCKRAKKIAEVVICQYCLGAYSSINFRFHWKNCSQKPLVSAQQKMSMVSDVVGLPDDKSEKIKSVSSKNHCEILPSSRFLDDEKLVQAQKIIFKHMQMTDVGRLAIQDKLILMFAAERMPGVSIDSGRLEYFRQGVRDLSNLLLEVKTLDKTITELKDCFECSKFDTLIKAVYNISETDYSTGTVRKISYNTRLRPPLGQCCKLLMSEVRKHFTGLERDLKLKSLQYFLDELESRWARVFGSLAQRQMRENRHGKVLQCADPQDVKDVFNYCIKSLPEHTAALKNCPTSKNYDDLMRLVILSMYATSRRRSCDLQHLTVSDYKALEKNRELCEKLGQTLELPTSLLEKISSLYCIFSCGKDQLSTAILLTEDMKLALDCILDTRQLYKIEANHIFVKLESNITPWKVDYALEWAKKNFKLKDPTNFGVRGLRHLTGTVAQVLTKHDPNIEGIFQEGLSHSDAVSKRYYRGNLASRLIQGYGLPLMEQMVDTSKTNNLPKAPETVTTSELAASDSGSTLPNEKNYNLTLDDNSLSTQDNLATKFVNLNEKTPVVRTPWCNEEDMGLIRQFYKIIKIGHRVSSSDIKKGIKNEPILKGRTEAQVRTRLSHIRLGATTTTKKIFTIIDTLSSPDAKSYGKK